MTTLAELGGWPALLNDLLARRDLTASTARAAMANVLGGEATPAQLAAFLVALKAKGESAEEISGLLDAVFEAATLVPLSDDTRCRAIDLVGTGGDNSHSINVSTIAALVVAGAGVPVCKHGNRGASSKCGSADLLEALGVRLELDPPGVAACVEEAGIGFCFAQKYHPAFRFAGPTRREIGIRTAFNLLGPMANPGRVQRQVIGVADPAVAERMLATLQAHGSVHAWVVHGAGLDELSTVHTSDVLELRDGEIRSFSVDAQSLGIAATTSEQLTGGDPAENAAYARRVLDGESGPHRDIVLLNAAAGLVVGGAAADLPTGLTAAAASLDTGAAAGVLERLVVVSNR